MLFKHRIFPSRSKIDRWNYLAHRFRHPNLYYVLLEGGEGKNVWDWRRDETGRVDVKVVICLDLAIKQGNGRAVTFVLESADTLHGRLSPPGKASWSTQLCVTQGPINRTCIARSGPLAFFFFSFFLPLATVIKRPGQGGATRQWT